MLITPITKLEGTFSIPSDKSISHRSVMFGSLALGTTHISNFLMGDDCLSTINCFRKLGVNIQIEEDTVTIEGKGLHGLTPSEDILDCGNSGTTVRLISGILSGQAFSTTLTGDASIQKRPMKRIIKPLSEMGATLEAKEDNFCPMTIHPHALKGICYHSPVASAQVKSSILLAGLYADGPTTVIEPAISRDHTERMLTAFGATVTREGTAVTIEPCKELYATDIVVPGDISSAAFFMVAGLITPGSDLVIQNVGINPTRAGILKICEDMGARIELSNERTEGGEKIADITVRTSRLHGTVIEGDIIPALIDEIPVIAVMAAVAEGTTVIRDAAELKVKETDRIETVTDNLKAMGCDVTPTENGMIINGGKLKGASIHTLLDHRIAMAFSIAALAAEGRTRILDSKCVDVSYPAFYDTFEELL